jgi:hypothetical protein
MWDEARILEIENNGRYKKYKESAYMACLTVMSANLDWLSLPSGFQLTAMRRPNQRDYYVVMDSALAYTFKSCRLGFHSTDRVIIL